ncbi:Cytochrome P450 9b2 [Gryllus bimaculatus]|nr:Cytochrome P450 9b2 [Gryllus bimaculatus]
MFFDRWKTTRQTLTPSFTNSKLKPLLPLMEEVAAELVQYLRTNCHTCGPDGFEAKDLCSKYTMEIVATSAFGIKGHSFQNPKAELREMTMQLLQPGLKKSIELMLINFLPSLADLLKLRMMPVEVDQYFRGVVRTVVDEREKKNITRNDFMQNLINLKKKAEENGETYSDEDITAHAVTFMTDGFETSAIVLSFVLHELARHPDVQEQLWQEWPPGRLAETLRLHPALPAMEKVCTRPITLRAADGTELHVPKGQLVVLPVLAFHKDPRYFQDPERFDPDRFSPGRKSDIPKYMFLGFGGGPRQCLGMRFALQQTKLAIATMVEHFVIKATPKTPKVIEQDPTSFLACAKGGLWVRFEERQTSL